MNVIHERNSINGRKLIASTIIQKERKWNNEMNAMNWIVEFTFWMNGGGL